MGAEELGNPYNPVNADFMPRMVIVKIVRAPDYYIFSTLLTCQCSPRNISTLGLSYICL